MAAAPGPNPDHPLVVGLDPMFTGPGGHAPALAGWIEYLAHPEENQGPRVTEFRNGAAWETTRKLPWDEYEIVNERSVLRDLGIDRFFAHADVLSGQKIGSLNEHGEVSNTQVLGATFDLLEEVRLGREIDLTVPDQTADVWTSLTENLGFALNEKWAEGKPRARFVQLKQWYENHRDPALAEMNKFLVAYAGILMKARSDINELMGKLVDALNKSVASNPIEGIAFFLSALEEVLNLTLNFPKTLKDATLTVVSGVKKAFDLATKSETDTGFGLDLNDIHLGYYRCFESFIRAGDAVCWAATEAVTRLITDAEKGLLFVRRNWVPAPTWS
ncbi:hypothetical protein [Prauserella muralis]|nr:hypothetical protein [Prauserella muralis]TWE22515.1 hypothetical protein FHX69_3757 [Prauserella muralis]